MFLNFFRKRTAPRTAIRSTRRFRLEALEQRDVPTATLIGGIVTIDPTDPKAVVNATTTVQIDNRGTWFNPYDDKVVVTRTTPGHTETQSFAIYSQFSLVGHPPAKVVKGIVFNGGAGQDTFKNMTSIPATAYGGDGNAWLYAGSGGDKLVGGSGNDHLFGGAGNDVLIAGTGNDVVVSIGGGVDQLYTAIGHDQLWCDTKDVTHIPTPQLLGTTVVHRVSSFYSYSYNGGNGQTAVPLELKGQGLASPLPGQPGLQLENFKNMPLFGSMGPQVSDVVQGAVGDCYFLSTLGAMARTNPDSINRLVADLGDGTYAVHFHDAQGKSVFVRVNADLWTDAEGSLQFARLGQQNALWVPIVEKAWAFFRDQMGNYPSISGGNNPGVPLDKALGLGTVTQHPTGNYANGQAYLSAIQKALSQNQAVTFGAPGPFTDSTPMIKTNDNSSTYRRGQHIYVVEAVLTDGNGKPTGIKLYNPWGYEVTIHSADLIYFCSGGFASFQAS
jgi:hypothetical protein